MFHPSHSKFTGAADAHDLSDMIQYEMHLQELQLEEARETKRHYLIGSGLGCLVAIWAYFMTTDIVAYLALALDFFLLWRCQAAATEASFIEYNRYARECHLRDYGFAVEYFPSSPGSRVRIRPVQQS